MTDTPDLDSVLEARQKAFSPEPTQPRIGIPTAADTDELDRRDAALETLQSTTDDLKAVAEAREKRLSHTYGAGTAAVLTVAAIVVAVLVAFLGMVLYNIGVNWDLSGGD